MELIIGALIGVCFFIVPIWSYRRGLKDGLALNKDKPIEPIKSPIQAVQQHIETKKADKKQQEELEGISAIMGYDPFAKEVKHETNNG